MPIFRETIEKRQAEEIESIRNSSRGFTPHLCKGAGFTLIEIAIVLVIIGILLSIGTGMIGTLTKRAKLGEAREIINAAVESVISYGASNKKLPLQGDFTPDVTIDEFVEIVRNPRDAWTKTLYYIVDSNLTTIPAGSTDAICGRKTTDLIVCRDVNCTDANKITNVAFAVISGADNYNVQTGIITGGTCPSGQTCVRVYEVDTPSIDDCTNSTNCPNYPAAEMINRQEPYDDIVKWITIDELRIKAGCVGAQLRILNNELPFGTKSTVYATAANPVRVIADGGVPFSSGGYYRWCRQESASTGLTFSPSTLNANCLGLAETSWVQSDNIIIYGTPNEAPLSSSSNYTLTFFVRDNNDSSDINDNIAQKAFVLTINPTPPPVIVRNATGTTRYYRIDRGSCVTMISNATVSVGFTQMITFFTTSGNCNNNEISCSHNNATLKAYDTDTDGQVRLSNITDTSCTIADD